MIFRASSNMKSVEKLYPLTQIKRNPNIAILCKKIIVILSTE